jgi:protein SCO1/2
LTISKLAQLRALLDTFEQRTSIRLAAITYDGGFDLPERLKAYAEARHLACDENTRLFRTSDADFSALAGFLNLGVNFSGSLVNQHRIELFLLDRNADVRSEFTRLQWSPDEVLERMKDLLQDKAPPPLPTIRKRLGVTIGHATLTNILPILIAFFPKCPICWMAYASMFGALGLNSIPYTPWLIKVLFAALVVNVVAIFVMANRRKIFLPFYLTLAGSISLALAFIYPSFEAARISGIVLVFLASVLNALPHLSARLLRL